MKEEVKETKETINETANVETKETTTEKSKKKTFDEIVKGLLADGARKFSGLKVKNVVITNQDDYDRITFVLKKEIPAFVSNDNGNSYEEGESNLVYSSSYALSGLLKEFDDFAWLANHLVKAPEIASNLFCGAEITVLQERINGDKPYVKPFSQDSEPMEPFGHDTFVNHIIGFKLGDSGKKCIEKLTELKLKAALGL